MKFLRGTAALALCLNLGLPAPTPAQESLAQNQGSLKTSHRQEYSSTQMRGDDRILHALNRFTFGPRPGDVDAVRKMGLERWFEEQLHPASIDEADLNARLAEFPAMQWSMPDLFFRLPSNAIVRQAADGKVQIPEGALHAVYENSIYRLQARKEAKAEKSAVAANHAPETAATAPGTMNGNGGLEPTAQSMAQPGAAGAGSGQAATTPAESNSMTPAPTMNANQADEQARADEGWIRRMLALPPQERVARLQAMQPEQFESFIKSLRPPQRQALVAGMSPELKQAVGALDNPEQTVAQELFAQRLTRDIYAKAQLQEVMTDFWLNHFNVYLHKNEQMPYYLVSYERDTIRPRALGKFEDLLEAVAHSPAMMLYLDNAESMGPDSAAAERAKMMASRRPGANKKADAGLNENYARELMELHTMGVNGGYTQADVVQVARVLTGWTVDRPQLGGGFLYAPQRHEPGTKTVMGAKIKENGEMEGEQLLHMLALRPATAQFISRKLAVRFVSDDPPQALVERMAKAYLKSDGDISAMLRTLFRSPELWATNDYRAKVKTPLEFVVSAARASNANIQNFQPLENALRQMGMPLYGCMPPTGYKWDAADWVSTGALVDRMNFALSLAANRLPGITVEWAPEMDMNTLLSDVPAQQVIPTPDSEEARLEPMLVAGGVSDATRKAALEQFQVQIGQNEPIMAQVANRRPNRGPAADQYEREDQVLAGLLLGSPEFQRR